MILNHKLIVGGLILLIIASIATSIYFWNQQHVYNVSPATVSVPTHTTSTLSFVGDIMLDRGVKGKVATHGAGDYSFLFKKADFLKTPNIMFGNLEGPVSDRGHNVGSIYSFRFEPVVMTVLKNAGFDVLSMANNHIGDWTKTALEDTLFHGKQAEIEMVGGGITYVEAIQPKIIETNGIKVGYLAFSDFGPDSIIVKKNASGSGVLSASDPDIKEIIFNASKQVNILAVSIHFGDEYEPLSNSRQKRIARDAIDAGAVVVVGHHPHVAQEVEEYNGGIIAYSLGNFIFDQYFSEETMQGLKLDVVVSKNGIESYSTSTVYQNKNSQPSLSSH